MCGISGIKVKLGADGKPLAAISVPEIKLLALALEHRGNDATGVAIQDLSGETFVMKDDNPAWQFVVDKQFENFLDEHLSATTETVLVHTRFATQGTPRDNANNHPLFAGKSAVIHNGIIANDSHMFDSLRLERKAETDSDVIRAILDSEGFTPKAIRTLSKMSGSVAAAAVHPDFPHHVLLMRSGGPLMIGATENKLYWASEKAAIYRAARPWIKRFGILLQYKADIPFIPMAENSAWLFGPSGLVWHQEFTACGRGWIGNRDYSTDRVHCGYKARQERLDREVKHAVKDSKKEAEAPKIGEAIKVEANMNPTLKAPDTPVPLESPDYVYCPNNNCNEILAMGTFKGRPLWQLRCSRCKTGLEGAEVVVKPVID